MTLAKPKEHVLSRKLRKLAEGTDNDIDRANLRQKAAMLDQTIHVLGIWKDPERIKHTNAYRDAEQAHVKFVRAHGV